MSLSEVSTASLERLRTGLRNGRLGAPLMKSDLVAFGVREQLEALEASLGGHSRLACLSLLDAVLAERAKLDRPAPELVWTGPEGKSANARDTAVVLRELFRGARRRVVLAGYSFDNARSVLDPLHEVMRDDGVRADFFIDIDQATSESEQGEAYGQEALAQWSEKNWRFGPPKPNLYCDRRALIPPPPWSSLHAKCVAVDGERAFVSSANFTLRGQDRNIETGVLFSDPRLARQLERQWMSLVEGNLVLCRSG